MWNIHLKRMPDTDTKSHKTYATASDLETTEAFTQNDHCAWAQEAFTTTAAFKLCCLELSALLTAHNAWLSNVHSGGRDLWPVLFCFSVMRTERVIAALFVLSEQSEALGLWRGFEFSVPSLATDPKATHKHTHTHIQHPNKAYTR